MEGGCSGFEGSLYILGRELANVLVGQFLALECLWFLAAGKHCLTDLSHAIVIARGPVKCAEENMSVSQLVDIFLFLCWTKVVPSG